MRSKRNILNQEFRDFCRVNKYPMTTDSSFVTTDGRAIPVGLFIDLIIYPLQDTPRNVYISSIYRSYRKLVFEFRNDTSVLGTAVSDLLNEDYNYIYDSHKNIIGTIVMDYDSLVYVYGLTLNKKLEFNSDALVVHPSRVLSFIGNQQQLFINGAAVSTDKPISITFTSDRFVQDTSTGAYDLNLTVTDLNINNTLPTMLTINGYNFKNNQAWIYADKDSNIRISTREDNTLYFYRKGDTINV